MIARVQERVQVPPASGNLCEERTACLKALVRQARTAAAVFTQRLRSPDPALFLRSRQPESRTSELERRMSQRH
jgi:hypothetical protein